MTRLLHYSAKPLLAAHYTPQHHTRYHKPCGLWVSVEGEDDWLSYCWYNFWSRGDFECISEVVLRPDARILRITTMEQLREFGIANTLGPGRDWYAANYIDWNPIALQYQGIIIAPYQWDCRLDPVVNWYYTWDCASGCIWEPSAVESITPLPLSDQAHARVRRNRETAEAV